MFSHELEYIFNEEYREWYNSLFQNNNDDEKAEKTKEYINE